jgi:hypothetical protein
MSSNGKRTQTLAWDATGAMSRSSGQVVMVDDTPLISGAIEIIEDGPSSEEPVRERKSTLQAFNEELAVLERPLEGEVEYVDEAPPPSRLKRMGISVGVVLTLMGIGGGIWLSRRQAAAGSLTQAEQQAAAPAMAPALVIAAPAAAAPAPPAAVAGAPAGGADEKKDSSKDGLVAVAGAPSPTGAERATKGGHAKHARLRGKNDRHHAASKHAGTRAHARSHREG